MPRGRPHNSQDPRKAPGDRMEGLLATLLFLHLGLPLEAACPPADLTNRSSSSPTLTWEWLDASQTCVNVSGKNFNATTVIPGSRSPLKELDLSHNHIQELPTGFLNHTEGLERLFLQGNGLRELPPALFEKTTRLKELRLEGNPLRSVPASLFHLSLETLSVDCNCSIFSNLSSYHQKHNYTPNISCYHSSPNSPSVDFTSFTFHCQGLSLFVYATIAVSVLALLLGAAVVYVLIRRKRRAPVVQAKRESSTSNGAQARYISHVGPQVNPVQGVGGHADYENVFIGQPQEASAGHKEQHGRKPSKSRSRRKVQEEEPHPGEQPIYANTQEVYYNYVGTPAPLDEDLYVMPD